MAGVWKTFTLTPAGHVQRFFLPFQDTFLPTWSLWIVGSLIPIVEFVAGALVIAGLFTRPALIALGFVLVIVTFGHLLHEPLYAFHEHVIPRLALLLVLMLMPAEADRYSVDAFIASKRRARSRIDPP